MDFPIILMLIKCSTSKASCKFFTVMDITREGFTNAVDQFIAIIDTFVFKRKWALLSICSCRQSLNEKEKRENYG